MASSTALEERATSRGETIRSYLAENGLLVLFLLPAVVILIVTQGYPLAYSAYFSLHDWTLARSPHPGPYIGFDNLIGPSRTAVHGIGRNNDCLRSRHILRTAC